MDVEVQVLRGLLVATVRHEPTPAVFGGHLPAQLGRYRQQLVDKRRVSSGDRRQRFDMSLRDDDEVYLPIRLRVAERKNVLSLGHCLDGDASGEHFGAVEVHEEPASDLCLALPCAWQARGTKMRPGLTHNAKPKPFVQ
jgi:hypothetical protein